MPELDLKGRAALVTGGSSGIGAAISRELAAHGAQVVINYLSGGEHARALAEEIARHGGEACPVAGDISRAEDAERMVAAVAERWGKIDILVNNAGIEEPRALSWEADLDAWKKVIDVNLVGSYLCSRAALARMVPAGSGVIVFITSVHDTIPWAGHSAYTSTKAGLAMLMKTLAQEAAPHGVRVAAVAPGAIRTPINQEVWSDPAGRADLESKIPALRIGQPEEVARTVAFLASDAASYVTGASLRVDGGMTLYPAFQQGG